MIRWRAIRYRGGWLAWPMRALAYVGIITTGALPDHLFEATVSSAAQNLSVATALASGTVTVVMPARSVDASHAHTAVSLNPMRTVVFDG